MLPSAKKTYPKLTDFEEKNSISTFNVDELMTPLKKSK